jgi:hypothetical protein
MKLFFGTFDLNAAFEKDKKKWWEEYGKKIFFSLRFKKFLHSILFTIHGRNPNR